MLSCPQRPQCKGGSDGLDNLLKENLNCHKLSNHTISSDFDFRDDKTTGYTHTKETREDNIISEAVREAEVRGGEWCDRAVWYVGRSVRLCWHTDPACLISIDNHHFPCRAFVCVSYRHHPQTTKQTNWVNCKHATAPPQKNPNLNG